MTSKPGTDGPRQGRVRARRRPRSLAAILAVCAAVLLSAVPGVAGAAPPMTVTPFVDCYGVDAHGTHTIVLGYSSTWDKPTTIGRGDRNSLFPEQYHGSQPKEFLTGEQHGAFSLQLSAAEVEAGARWELDRTTLVFSSAKSAQCSSSTPLPALGNGAAIAAVLVAAGAFGVWFVRRVIRRAAAPV